jgi:hypothetical protein
VSRSGFALLGELPKFLRVAATRFSSVVADPGGVPGLSVLLEGASGEAVQLAFLLPGPQGAKAGFPALLQEARVGAVLVHFPVGGGSARVTCGAAEGCRQEELL